MPSLQRGNDARIECTVATKKSDRRENVAKQRANTAAHKQLNKQLKDKVSALD